ncbi:hypothetical protein NDU88_003681 [Pleurodeles waltl]|uniref:Uncharacterized protein n=1 Tax=Pleurodeles waltl TaxID=8319 RepID=A0AAV7LGF9_PLEWA|nr:hypothetical protein NDU88_003681 [Pleurodeles waltl]
MGATPGLEEAIHKPAGEPRAATLVWSLGLAGLTLLRCGGFEDTAAAGLEPQRRIGRPVGTPGQSRIGEARGLGGAALQQVGRQRAVALW